MNRAPDENLHDECGERVAAATSLKAMNENQAAFFRLKWSSLFNATSRYAGDMSIPT
jgi:hypothetical protein